MRPAFSLGETATPPPYASLAEAILAGVERLPEGRFLYFGQDGQTREVSYRETLAQARRLIEGLRRKGIRAGDALLINLKDAKDMVPALWAAAIGGFVAVPAQADGKAAMPGSEKLVFLNEVFEGLRVLTDEAAGTINLDPALLDFSELASTSDSSETSPAAGKAEDLRIVILTSGTTARPKLVGLSDRAALARWWPQLPDAAHANGFLSWASFGHVMGIGLAMPNLPLKAHLDATRFVAMPHSWLDVLTTTGATHATMTNFGMSLVLRAIVENPDRRWRLEHVRKIGIGAEAISRKTCDRFLKRLAEFGLREDALILGYGLSECGPVVGGSNPFSAGDAEDVDSPPELDRPVSGHAVRIVGDTGYLLREGEVGQIEVRGPTMTSGYLGDDVATAALFTQDQWLRTGDLGFLRNGKLTVVGREKELVVVNARKYSCQDIERAVRDRTSFPEVYVAPLDNAAEAGAAGVGAPCAIFVAVDRPGDFAPKQIADAVRAATAEAFRFAPRAVAIVSHDDIPRTSVGKVRRLALPALLAHPKIAKRVNHLSETIATTNSTTGNAEVEMRVARIWRELLRSEDAIDRDADFFALGGDSLLALRMSFLLEDEFGVPVRLERLPAKLSISELAFFLSGASPASRKDEPQSSPDSGLPDWLIGRLRGFLEKWPGTPVLSGGLVRRVGQVRQGVPIFWCMQQPEEASHFERTVGGHRPAYTFRSGQWLLTYGTPVAEALADLYVEEIKAISQTGPLVIGGTCQGVNIALAVTRQLVAQGRDVRLLAAAECRFAQLCEGSPVPVPVALFPAIRSNFNPYRYFRHPEIGLRKLAPHGLRLEMINSSHTKIMVGPAMEQLARGLEAAIAWAGTHESPVDKIAIPSPEGMYQCRISTPLKMLELRSGESLSLAVKLKNTSAVAWEPFDSSGLMIGNHWLSDDGGLRVWSDGRAPLKRRLEPGERTYMTLDIVAPHEPGEYLLEVDLVEEGIRWFADVPIPPLQIPARVQPREGRGRSAQSLRSDALSAVFRLADKLPLATSARRHK